MKKQIEVPDPSEKQIQEIFELAKNVEPEPDLAVYIMVTWKYAFEVGATSKPKKPSPKSKKAD